MDITTDPLDEARRLQDCTQKIADFIALSEEALKKLEQHDVVTGKSLQTTSIQFNQQLSQIHKMLAELEEFMTQAGVARFRVSAERMLSEGEKHLHNILEATEKFKKIAEESCQNLQHVSESSADWIAEAIKSLQVDKFRSLIFENVDRVEHVADTSIARIHKMARWFQWEKLGIALVVAILVSLLTGLFVNDELPWETHTKVVTERNVGKMLMQAWPKLSLQERESIQSAASSQYMTST